MPQALDGRIALGQVAEGRIDGKDVWVREIDRRRGEVARWTGGGRGRIDWSERAGAWWRRLGRGQGRRDGYCTHDGSNGLDYGPPRQKLVCEHGCWHIGREDLPF